MPSKNNNILFNKIISITKYQRNYIKTTLNELAETDPENATILCDYIITEQNEINIKESTKEWKIKNLVSLLIFVGHKNFKEITKQDILDFLNNKRKPDVLGKNRIIKRLYDPAAGTGGMLSISEEFIREKFPSVNLEIYGQEINDMTYAICKSDMLLKGLDPDSIKFGNSLTNLDGFPNEEFDYMLSNPPFGVDWKKYEDVIKKEFNKGNKGRYVAGLPRTSDGSLLFLMHMISKMRNTPSISS